MSGSSVWVWERERGFIFQSWKHVYGCASYTFPSLRLAKGHHPEALALHFVMFLPTLYAQCDPKQSRKWLPLAESFQVLGTYAQTEMGHGQCWTKPNKHRLCTHVKTCFHKFSMFSQKPTIAQKTFCAKGTSGHLLYVFDRSKSVKKKRRDNSYTCMVILTNLQEGSLQYT